MSWKQAAFLSLALLLGCQTPERAAIQPLPPDAPPPNYPELVQRARSQVSAAQEYFYRDSWNDVTQAAHALQQTGAYLEKLKPDQVPESKRGVLAKQTKELTEAATALHEAGEKHDVYKTTEAFQRLHLAIRELRP